MSKYYQKLINKHKLMNFCCFFGTDFKNIFAISYKFIFCFYKKNIFFDFNWFISIVRKIFPIFDSIVDNKGKFLFIGTKYIYSQIIHKNKTNFISEAIEWNVGAFTNFRLNGFNGIYNFKLFKNPSIILFFQNLNSNFLILEAKKKNIPIIGLIGATNSNGWSVDYPIFLNSSYFYNIYILSRFFFKYILKLI